MRLASMLLASAAAGLLASALLSAQTTKSIAKSEHVGATISSSTAQVLQSCAIALPQMQVATFAQALNPWTPAWLLAQKDGPRTSEDTKDDLCAQLLSASLQGPSPNNEEHVSFLSSLSDAVRQMQAQIATQVQNDALLANKLAPLMGLNPKETLHLFQSKKLTPTPVKQERGVPPSEFTV